MLAAYFLRPHRHQEKAAGRTMRVYTWLVTWAVRHRYTTVVLALMLFVGSMAAATLLPSGFLPAAETSRSLLAVELPPGSQLADTEMVTDAVATRLRRRAEVESVFVDGGRIPRRDRNSFHLSGELGRHVRDCGAVLAGHNEGHVTLSILVEEPVANVWYVGEVLADRELKLLRMSCRRPL